MNSIQLILVDALCSLFLTAGTSFFRITNNIQIEGIQEKSIETYLQVLHIFMIDLKGI